MRKFADNGSISVFAVAGTHVVLLGMDAEPSARRDLLGFAIKRTHYRRDGKRRESWLRGTLTFEETESPGRRTRRSQSNDGQSNDGQNNDWMAHPIQDFQWRDYTARPGEKYRYTVIPLYGTPASIKKGKSVSVTVRTEAPEDGKHDVYFNRGVAGSQGYIRLFGDKSPDEVPKRKAYQWLSRGLEEAMLAFIGQADGPQWGLRAGVYEFSYLPALEAFGRAQRRGADVQIVFDDKEGKDPSPENREAIQQTGIGPLTISRTQPRSSISHNKFIILLKNNRPQAVFTGSTNMTRDGIFGHSNVGHVVRDRKVAQTYLDYWNEMANNPTGRPFREFNDQHTPVRLKTKPKTQIIFSPRGSLEALEHYGQMASKAQSSVFLTAAFGISNELTEIFSKPRRKYQLYVVLDKPGQRSNRKNYYQLKSDPKNHLVLGSLIDARGVDGFNHEKLTGFNEHVEFIHTKYMLIDPLGDQPIVITGSANFSAASTTKNDENMLVIRNNTRVADIYLGEFMRLFAHFHFRDQINDRHSDQPLELHLSSDDSWTDKHFKRGSAEARQRQLFAGKAG